MVILKVTDKSEIELCEDRMYDVMTVGKLGTLGAVHKARTLKDFRSQVIGKKSSYKLK